MICCIMRASMNDEFDRKFEEAQPEEMLQVLRDSVGTPDDVEWHKTSCIIFQCSDERGCICYQSCIIHDRAD